jgi:hypothetical protein
LVFSKNFFRIFISALPGKGFKSPFLISTLSAVRAEPVARESQVERACPRGKTRQPKRPLLPVDVA